MGSHGPELRDMLKNVGYEKETIDIELLDYDEDKIDDIARLSNELFPFFSLILGGEALTISEGFEGNSFEVWRLLCKEYDAKTPPESSGPVDWHHPANSGQVSRSGDRGDVELGGPPPRLRRPHRQGP
eukprot:12108874-Heterocapsa_arctica.AAC.1